MKSLLAFTIRAFPRAFREAFAPEMLEVMLADYERARARGRFRALLFVSATLTDALVQGIGERLNPAWIDPNAYPRARRWQVRTTLEAWMKDLVHGARSLSRAPGFALVTVATLALAIGANTAIFSVVKAVLLDPLPFPEADRLVVIRGSAPGSDLPEETGITDEFYVEYREHADALEDAGLFQLFQSTMRSEERVDRLFMGRATPSVFTTLGVRPVVGRLPTAEDDDRVVVISDWLWRTWFGADPSVVGRSYDMAGQMRTVIGVMAPEFRFPDERVALWVTWPIDPADLTPGGFGRIAVGRLVPGAPRFRRATRQANALGRGAGR